MNRVWGRERRTDGILDAVLKTLFYRFRAFVMLVVVGLLVWASFAVSLFVAAARPFTRNLFGSAWLLAAAHPTLSIAVNAGLLMLLYKTLSKAKIRWTSALRGGLLAAILWEIGRQILNLLMFGGKYTAYGVVGSLLALMLWIYFASSIFFFAAEYVRVMEEES
jgi:membrane protein